MPSLSEDSKIEFETGEPSVDAGMDTDLGMGFAPGGFQTEIPSDADAGFGDPSASLGATDSSSAPTPLPKRPKGRLTVGVILLLICALVGHRLWTMFFYHTAYGTLNGHVAQLAAPWDGMVLESNASESQEFRQSETVARIDSLVLRHQIDRLGDDLRMAQAQLDAQISKLRWEAQETEDLSNRVAAQHFEAQGSLAESKALLERLRRDRVRAEGLTDQKAISIQRKDQAVFSELGLRQKVTELESSAEMWKRRSDRVQALKDGGSDQLAPQLAAIENLQNEIVRLRETLEEGQLRAPFDSIVVTRHKLVGERVEAQEPVLELLQTGSLEVVIYLSQNDIDRIEIGDVLKVKMEPYSVRIPCTVVRIGHKLRAAPPAIERYYWSNEPLLPVYLKPDAAHRHWMSLRLGSVVKW